MNNTTKSASSGPVAVFFEIIKERLFTKRGLLAMLANMVGGLVVVIVTLPLTAIPAALTGFSSFGIGISAFVALSLAWAVVDPESLEYAAGVALAAVAAIVGIALLVLIYSAGFNGGL